MDILLDFLKQNAIFIVIGALIIAGIILKKKEEIKNQTILQTLDLIMTGIIEDMKNMKISTQDEAYNILYSKVMEVMKNVDLIPKAKFDDLILIELLNSEMVSNMLKQKVERMWALRKVKETMNSTEDPVIEIEEDVKG